MKHFLSASLAVLGTVIATSPAGAVGIIPSQLNIGDQYRLVFVTSVKTTRPSSDISLYNNFVTSVANSVGAVGAQLSDAGLCASVTCTWSAIASTQSVAAIDNTQTQGVGIPIYLVESGTPVSALTKITDNYLDLWDGSIQDPIENDEFGKEIDDEQNPNCIGIGDVVFDCGVWTGTTVSGDWKENEPGIVEIGWTTDFRGDWIEFVSQSGGLNRMYGMSEVLSVPIPEPLTILGTFTALGFGTLFKKKKISSKAQ